MSAFGDELLDLNPIKELVQENLLDVKRELDEREPVIQKRITECEKRIQYSIKNDIPETVEILRKNVELRKRIVSERDNRIKEIDDVIAEIDADITALPDTEENVEALKALKEEKQEAIKKKEETDAKFTVLLNRLDADKVKTLEFSRATITETINIGKQTIEQDKAELAALKEKKRHLTLSYRQLSYIAPPKKPPVSKEVPTDGPSSSPRLNGGPQ
jgi:hypothetical protein